MKSKTLFYTAFAALAQGVLWVNVFSLLHHNALAYIGGIPAGIAIVGLVVYSANALPRVQSKRARQAGWSVLVLLVIVEPIVLGFANYPVVMNQPIGNLGANVVSGGASLTLTLSLILGALVDRSLVPAEKPAKPARKPKEAKVEPAKPAFSCSCGKEFGSQSALNAHQRKHKRVIGYTASFEPITESQAGRQNTRPDSQEARRES